MMDRIKKGFHSWYFAAASPDDLSYARIVFFSILFLFHFLFDYRPLFYLPEELWRGVGIMGLFFSQRPPEVWIEFAYWFLPVCLFFCVIGLFTRLFSFLTLIVGTFYWGFGQSVGHMFRIDCLVIMAVAVLCFCPMSDSLSVDRLLFGRCRSVSHYKYNWPRKLIQLLYTFIFFSAGYSKLVGAGALWLSGNFLRFGLLVGYITRNGYHEKFLANGIGIKIMMYPIFCWMIATVVISFEMLAPLATFSSRLRRVLLPMSIAFPFVVFILLGIPLLKYLAVLPFWFKCPKVYRSMNQGTENSIFSR